MAKMRKNNAEESDRSETRSKTQPYFGVAKTLIRSVEGAGEGRGGSKDPCKCFMFSNSFCAR